MKQYYYMKTLFELIYQTTLSLERHAHRLKHDGMLWGIFAHRHARMHAVIYAYKYVSTYFNAPVLTTDAAGKHAGVVNEHDFKEFN